LESSRAGVWLSGHPDPTIAVVASAEEVYKRRWEINHTGTLQQFKEKEYSAYRLGLYNGTKYRCDVTGLSLDKARANFMCKINEILRDGLGGEI
jgi:hypothetical protein